MRTRWHCTSAWDSRRSGDSRRSCGKGFNRPGAEEEESELCSDLQDEAWPTKAWQPGRLRYVRTVNMLEKSSVQTRKGRSWRRSLACRCNSGWAAAVAGSMMSVQEQEKHMVSSSRGFQW